MEMPRTDPPVGKISFGTTQINIRESFFFRACCCISVAVYVDYVNILSVSSFGFENIVKYAYFTFIISMYASILFNASRIQLGVDGPSILLIFTLFSTLALAVQVISPVQNGSYAAAFLATMLVSSAATIDIDNRPSDPGRIASIIQSLMLLLCWLYVGELFVRKFSGIAHFDEVLNQTSHIKSFILVASACFAVLLRDRRALLLSLSLLLGSQILRPSSSLIAALLLCAPVAVAIRRDRQKMAKGITYGVVISAALVPIALYLSPDLKEFISDVETWTKEDFLQGQSNTFFRLAIQDMAIDRLHETSILFGAMFSTSNTVELSQKFGWWVQYNPSGVAAIHSDYVSILYQSGAVGYILYNLALIMICRLLFSGLKSENLQRCRAGLIGLSICSVLAIVLYSSSNPFLQYFNVSHVAWFLVAVGYIEVRARKPSCCQVEKMSGS